MPSKREDNYNPHLKNNNLSDSDNPKEKMLLLKKEDVQNFFSGYYYSIDDKPIKSNMFSAINIDTPIDNEK